MIGPQTSHSHLLEHGRRLQMTSSPVSSWSPSPVPFSAGGPNSSFTRFSPIIDISAFHKPPHPSKNNFNSPKAPNASIFMSLWKYSKTVMEFKMSLFAKNIEQFVLGCFQIQFIWWNLTLKTPSFFGVLFYIFWRKGLIKLTPDLHYIEF